MTADLAAQIAAELDRLVALAQRAYDAEPGPWALHHDRTRAGRPDEWEIRDYDGDPLAWVGAENDARLIVATASPDKALSRIAAARRVLELVETMRRHARKRREMVNPSGFADDLDAYANELEAALAASLGVEP